MKLDQLCSDLVMVPNEHKDNLIALVDALNPLENKFYEEYGYGWKITSGYRFIFEHVRIYNEINEKRKAAKKKPLATPLGSQHLKGNAMDVYDPLGQVKEFVAKYRDLFKKAGIYIEGHEKTNGEIDWRWTPNWVHFQRVSPASKKFLFTPY